MELLKTLSSLLITDQIISNLLLLTTLYKLYKLDPFRQSQIRAKIAGKALAAIIKAGIFKNSSLTLIGFSLGAAVIMSCLQDLANHGEKYIHNTILMGGAASVSSQDWKNCKHAVSGRLINLYSKKDWVISVCYRITRFQKAIGSYKIDVDEIENWDVTDEIDSHQRYRQIMDKLFEKIHICG